MSEWMRGYEHHRRWLMLAARLEGIIEAHKILKGDDADEHDLLLYRLAAQVSKEADDADA